MLFQIERAQRYYQQAFEQLPAADRKAQRTGLIMAAIYRATLDEVVASGCHVLKERVSLTPLRKLWLACKTWLDKESNPSRPPLVRGGARIPPLTREGYRWG